MERVFGDGRTSTLCGRILDGEGMSAVCREFGISRKTGYKIYQRYKKDGLDALCDRSRRPVRYANQLPHQIERPIVDTKRGKPHWGARKIGELLVRRLAGDVRIPAISTVHAVLDWHGPVKQARQRRRFKAEGTPLSQATVPNELWCADYKSEFKLGNGRYCYSLTVTDQASRMILCCEALESTKEQPAIETFLRLFRERGLPEVEYPFHDRDILVTACGRICMARKKITVSTVLAGQRLGIKEVDNGIWLVSFMRYDLGYIDLGQRTLQTIDNPFGTRLSPVS